MFSPVHAFSGFSVHDLDEARAFYTEILGLAVTENDMGLPTNPAANGSVKDPALAGVLVAAAIVSLWPIRRALDVLSLGEAAAVSEGRLGDDEATAVATIAYLLEHQDAADLPELVDIGDVVAAYPDAVERIAGLRG